LDTATLNDRSRPARLFWRLLRTQSVLPLLLCTGVFIVTILWIMPVTVRNNLQSLSGQAINVEDVHAEITALSLKLGVASLAILVLVSLLLYRVFRWTMSTDYKRLQAERALADTNRRLAETNLCLQTKQGQLEGFLYAVSHDLKSPLISIQGFATILRESCDLEKHPKAAGYFDRIEGNIRNMESLLGDLMTLSRVGRIEDDPEPVSLSDLTKEILAERSAEIEGKRIRAVCGARLPSVHGRRNRVRQLLTNLVDNAIKYMPEKDGASIEVGFTDTAASPTGARGAFFVRDNGAGIEPVLQSKVFEIFQRGPNMGGRKGGSGLGLAIVRSIAESHGGSVWLTSKPGAGSTFYFTLSSFPDSGADRQIPA